jgi:catechol 2,3-dioxygenase-like lactoylglutathione lyase family enzyme
MKCSRLFFTLILILDLPMLLPAQHSTSRPPITGIANVSVYASSPGQSRQFYAKLLGFPETSVERNPAAQRYKVNQLQFIQVDPLPNGVADYLESVAFATPDVEALRRYLLSKNVVIPDKVRKHADGTRTLWVNDPEGHCIEFVQAGTTSQPSFGATHAQVAQISQDILHAGFIVHDRAAEDHFFRDILGFHQAWQGGRKDGIFDWVNMQVPDGGAWIEYMMHGPDPATARESGVLNHFSLGVSNIQQAADYLTQRGWHSSSREKAQIGLDGKWQLNLYDPDGTRVEVMEFRPVQTPCCSPYTLPAHP